MSSKQELYQEAISLLQQLIAIPSFSKEEDKTADAIHIFLEKAGVQTNRYLNN
ncbi:acetylornithine deacetylase, partial [Escherichia coli]|nr:acetylornithine deacetylase [Escherichia coli]